MAVPLFAPFVALKPIIKVLAVGSIKFVVVGVGAAVAPVVTANFLVGLAAGTPLKYAQFRHRKGRFTSQQLDTIESANQLVQSSIKDKNEHLSRKEAREFLKEILLSTVDNMKTNLFSVPGHLTRFGRLLKTYFQKPSSKGHHDR
jgi:hypothetical protein